MGGEAGVLGGSLAPASRPFVRFECRGRRGRLAVAAQGVALVALAAAVVAVALTASARPRGVPVELVGVKAAEFKNGNERIFRRIKGLTDWKIDWALGGDEPRDEIDPERLDEVAEDATHIASHLQVSEFPKDMRNAIDPSVEPCDDFYEFACGHWEESKGVLGDDDVSIALQWDQVDDEINARMRKLFETEDTCAAKFYRACLKDVSAVDAWNTLTPWMDLSETIVDNATFVDASIAIQQADMSVFFSWAVDIDSWNKHRYAVFLAPSSLSVGEGDLVKRAETGEESDDITGLREFVTTLVMLAGYDEDTAARDAENVISIEQQYAVGSNESDGGGRGYNQWIDRDYMAYDTPSIDWDYWFRGMNFSEVGVGSEDEEMDEEGQPLSSPRLIMEQGDYMIVLEDILSCKGYDQDKCWERVASYVRYRLLKSYAPYLDADFVDTLHDWHNRRYGARPAKLRDEKCFDDTTYLLGWSSSYLFVTRTFADEKKQATLKMLDEIREEFRDALTHTHWMDKKSRAAAQQKLDKMFFEVAYPDEWPESATRNEGQMNGTYTENVDTIGHNAVVRAQQRVLETPKRNRWGESYPIVVNAFYSPVVNGLFVPAGIIQRPFYSEAYHDARNYGSLGTICGHEMTHGFDDTGHLLDENGDQKDWWDHKTFGEFDARAGCLSSQYDRYGLENAALYDGAHVDGENTLGENIADEGGMRFAYQAFTRSHPRARKNMAAHRLFFTAFAQNWCETDRKDVALDSLTSDEHAPAKYRVLGVLSNFKPFATAFNCPAGTPMNPVKRCELW